MFSVNVVGSRILELIELGWDESRIATEISQSFATSIAVVRDDVHDFIEDLRKREILTIANSAELMHRGNEEE
jgi:hypothetical protein